MKNGVARISLAVVVGLYLSTLSAISVHAQGVPTPPDPVSTASNKSYEAASVLAFPGLHCKLYPTGNAPSSGVEVFTDNDGYARFYAVRAAAGDAVRQLTLDCTDSEGNNSSYSVDLASNDTFAPRPVNLANEPGADRPALQGDPLSYTQSQLIQAGYGLRPDPVDDAAAYSRWLAAASRPGRLLEAKRPDPRPQGVTKTTVPPWTGSVLTGRPNYLSTEATFNVPTAIPGGDKTTSTLTSIWNGLGGFETGSGLIQGGVSVETTPTIASYGSWREYCCGAGHNSNGYGGAFIPNPGDKIYSEEWYCDSAGNPDLNGGYGCTFLQDYNSGAILSCTSPAGSPCWSATALPLCSQSPGTPNCETRGLAAEFIIENQSTQVSSTSTAFTDFTPKVTMAGSAYSSKTDKYSQTISTDPTVYLLGDFTNTTTRMTVTLGTTDQTYFSVSEVVPPTAPTGVKAKAGNAQATVSFSAPANNGGAKISEYTVFPQPGIGNYTATGTASPITVTGLTNGTSYTFGVTATNASGLTSPLSSPSNKATPIGPPGAPTNVIASAGYANALVSFDAPVSNGGSSITGYTATSSPGGKTGTGKSSPITVRGLTDYTDYTFTVTATNAAGTSPKSVPSNVVMPTLPPIKP